MLPYFKDKQADILKYKKYLNEHNMIIDKTNMMFLDLILNILNYLATEDADKLDDLCEYNILTMHKEFENVMDNNTINEKAQATLLTFFLRIGKEIEVKNGDIENTYVKELYTIMTSKGFKYPDYIGSQKNFALDKMPANITRMLHLK